MKKYQNFVKELDRIKKEEDRVKELYMKEFLTDIENALLKNGAIMEEVDKEDLHIRNKDTKGTYSTMPNKIKVYWISKKECGFYLSPLQLFTSIQVYEVGKTKFKCVISNLTPDDNLLNGKRYDAIKFIDKWYKYTKEKEFKRDLKKYNL